MDLLFIHRAGPVISIKTSIRWLWPVIESEWLGGSRETWSMVWMWDSLACISLPCSLLAGKYQSRQVIYELWAIPGERTSTAVTDAINTSPERLTRAAPSCLVVCGSRWKRNWATVKQRSCCSNYQPTSGSVYCHNIIHNACCLTDGHNKRNTQCLSWHLLYLFLALGAASSSRFVCCRYELRQTAVSNE